MVRLDTGRYVIQNAKFMNVAVLPDANDQSEIIGRESSGDPGEKVHTLTLHHDMSQLTALQWNVIQLNSGRYTIKSHGFDHFASCGYRADHGDNIQGRQQVQQLVIKETRIKTQYMCVTDSDTYLVQLLIYPIVGLFSISPSDATELYWGLPDGEMGTPV